MCTTSISRVPYPIHYNFMIVFQFGKWEYETGNAHIHICKFKVNFMNLYIKLHKYIWM